MDKAYTQEQINQKLQKLYLSCQEALGDSWDRSDDGFIAMSDDLEDIMNHYGIDIPEPNGGLG